MNNFYILETQAWVRRAVIGLNLCPFARSVEVKSLVRYVSSNAKATDDLLEDLLRELDFLAESPIHEVETTLLIHPHAFTDFMEFNDFLALAELAVDSKNLRGVLQIAAFHPAFQFEGTEANDITNATNRSPYPTLHLLREESIDRAVEAFPHAESIYENNMTVMQKLGEMQWRSLMYACKADAYMHRVPDMDEVKGVI